MCTTGMSLLLGSQATVPQVLQDVMVGCVVGIAKVVALLRGSAALCLGNRPRRATMRAIACDQWNEAADDGEGI